MADTQSSKKSAFALTAFAVLPAVGRNFLHRFTNDFSELLNPFIESGGDGQHGRFADFAFEFLQVFFSSRLVYLVRNDHARLVQQPRIVETEFLEQVWI